MEQIKIIGNQDYHIYDDNMDSKKGKYKVMYKRELEKETQPIIVASQYGWDGSGDEDKRVLYPPFKLNDIVRGDGYTLGYAIIQCKSIKLLKDIAPETDIEWVRKMSRKRLETVKKFLTGEFSISCKTIKQAEIFFSYLCPYGIKIYGKRVDINNTYWDINKEKTIYIKAEQDNIEVENKSLENIVEFL